MLPLLDVFTNCFTCAALLGECWPGPVAFPDFLNKKTRSWWAKLVKEFVAIGVDGIWNDMNEPAVFKVRILKLPCTILNMCFGLFHVVI